MKLHLVLALFAVQSVHADWVIVEKNTADDTKGVTIKVKDKMVRNDIGDKMTVILNTDENVARMYMHSKKSVMTMNLDAVKSMSALANKFLGGGDKDGPPKPKATGEHVKVGQWDTEVYTWESKLGSGKLYVAKDFPHYQELGKAMDKVKKAMNNPMANMYPGNEDLPGMVVKSEITVMGKAVGTELVSATESTLSDDEFKGPEGYKEMKMPSLPGGFGGKLK